MAVQYSCRQDEHVHENWHQTCRVVGCWRSDEITWACSQWLTVSSLSVTTVKVSLSKLVNPRLLLIQSFFHLYHTVFGKHWSAPTSNYRVALKVQQPKPSMCVCKIFLSAGKSAQHFFRLSTKEITKSYLKFPKTTSDTALSGCSVVPVRCWSSPVVNRRLSKSLDCCQVPDQRSTLVSLNDDHNHLRTQTMTFQSNCFPTILCLSN